MSVRQFDADGCGMSHDVFKANGVVGREQNKVVMKGDGDSLLSAKTLKKELVLAQWPYQLYWPAILSRSAHVRMDSEGWSETVSVAGA